MAPDSHRDSSKPLLLAGIDLPAALKRFSGNGELLLDLLRNFGKKWSGAGEALRATLSSGDLQQVRLTVHTLRGVAGNLSMSGVVAAAEALERALKRGDHESVPLYLEKLENTLNPVLAGLERLPPPSPTPVATGRMDRPQLERRISELAGLLRQHDMRAVACFTTLRAYLEGGGVAEQLTEQIERLDFKAAGKSLAEIVELLSLDAPT